MTLSAPSAEDLTAPDDAFAYSADNIGVASAFAIGLQETRTMYSTHGFEYFLRQAEEANNKRIVDAGGTPVKTLLETSLLRGVNLDAYTRFVRAVNDVPYSAAAADDESRSQVAARELALEADGRNSKYKELKTKFPNAGIKDLDELLGEVLGMPGEQRKQSSRVHGFMGNAAYWLGGVIAQLDPMTNPDTFALNVLGMGNGRTLLAKVLGDAGIGGVTAGIEEFTGVRENMRNFGIEPTTMGTLENIGMGMAAPIVLHGAVAGAQRVVKGRSPPPTPAPAPQAAPTPAPVPPPAAPVTGENLMGPLATSERIVMIRQTGAVEDRRTKMKQARLAGDWDTVAAMNDTWGVRPEDIEPPGTPIGMGHPFVDIGKRPSFAAPLDPDWVVKQREQAAINRGGFTNLGEAARALDPEVFNHADDLVRQLDEAKADLANAEGINKDRAEGKRTTLEAIVARKNAEIATARTEKARAKLKSELTVLVNRLASEPDSVVVSPNVIPTDPIKRRIRKAKASINKHRPNIERALARAGYAFDLDATQKAAVGKAMQNMRGEGDNLAPRAAFAQVPDATQVRLGSDRTRGIPEAAQARPGDNLADVAKNILSEGEKHAEKSAEDFTGSIKRILAHIEKVQEARKAGTDVTELEKEIDYRVGGTEVDIRDILNDKAFNTTLDEGGAQVTLRGMLQDLELDKQFQAAVTSCRVR